ncbi:MAG TPA: twin-arginine translocation signal domain-containing protein, partial [Burkholderiales bacterium]|nr:twin-arginine translocation signal domain-containing protein [Burkholderiales bacterium]
MKLRGARRGIATLTSEGETKMCILCVQGKPQDHSGSQLGRRDFLKASTATAAAAAGMSLFAARPASAHDD